MILVERERERKRERERERIAKQRVDTHDEESCI